MANEEVLGPRKTMFVLVIVVGCFAVLWPRILAPLILGNARDQLQPNQFDREAGCCEVIFDPEVAVLELVNEVCGLAVGAKLSPHAAAECRKAVNETCGVDIAAFFKRNENVGITTKKLLEIMKNSNSSCLKEHFGVPIWSLSTHPALNSWTLQDTLKQERPPIRGAAPHPALRERGRAIPAGAPTPPSRGPVPLPPHARVRSSPLSVYFELDIKPPPIPGMRPPLGSPGGPVPAPKSSMGFVMPIYTICIIVFFVYTLSKILFKRTGSIPYDNVIPDPQFRRRVFRDDSRTSPDTKLVVTAISGLVAEVQQQMEASYGHNQQRQDVQDNHTRPYSNGTVLSDSTPIRIITSELKESSKETSPEPKLGKYYSEGTEYVSTPTEHIPETINYTSELEEVRTPTIDNLEEIPIPEELIAPVKEMEREKEVVHEVFDKDLENVLKYEKTNSNGIEELTMIQPEIEIRKTEKNDASDTIVVSNKSEKKLEFTEPPEPFELQPELDLSESPEKNINDRAFEVKESEENIESTEPSKTMPASDDSEFEAIIVHEEFSPRNTDEINIQTDNYIKKQTLETGEDVPVNEDDVLEDSPARHFNLDLMELISNEKGDIFEPQKQISKIEEVLAEFKNDKSQDILQDDTDLKQELKQTVPEKMDNIMEPELVIHELETNVEIGSNLIKTSPEPIHFESETMPQVCENNEEISNTNVDALMAKPVNIKHEAVLLEPATDIEVTGQPVSEITSKQIKLESGDITAPVNKVDISESASKESIPKPLDILDLKDISLEKNIEMTENLISPENRPQEVMLNKETSVINVPIAQTESHETDVKCTAEHKDDLNSNTLEELDSTSSRLEKSESNCKANLINDIVIGEVDETIKGDKVEEVIKFAEDFLSDARVVSTEELENQKLSTLELLKEALEEEKELNEIDLETENKDLEPENASVKVVGMEVTAHSADGGVWPRAEPPPVTPVPSQRPPHEAEEVKSIFLETEIPQKSRVLVADFEDRPESPRSTKHSPLVVSGKMTLSLIQDEPRETPEREPDSTVDEFTTVSAATEAAAEKDEEFSEEEIEEEIEIEEIEEEEEEEEMPDIQEAIQQIKKTDNGKK